MELQMCKLRWALSICFLYVGAVSAAPNLISYQGNLNDGIGEPVNANVAFVFSIYDAPVDGIPLWTENQSIEVINGIFDVQLGADTPISAHIFKKRG